MTPRVPIGDLVDHDPRLYSFERNSRLPPEAFEQPDHWEAFGDVAVVLVCALAVILFATGVIG